jgi:starvation-inducible DNA-binding protein
MEHPMANKKSKSVVPLDSAAIHIGISPKDRESVSTALSHVMADTYSLYLQTHNFHWNVEGPMFNTLHLMFETQYNELWIAVDAIAERIRSLGFPAPGTYSELARLTSIEEVAGVPQAMDMVSYLVKGHEAVTRTARSAFQAADKAADESSADLLTQRLQIHEKTAWMLRSLLR